MNSTKIDPKYITKSNPRIGLIAQWLAMLGDENEVEDE